MKKTKKMMALWLTAAMALGSLAGCGGGSSLTIAPPFVMIESAKLKPVKPAFFSFAGDKRTIKKRAVGWSPAGWRLCSRRTGAAFPEAVFRLPNPSLRQFEKIFRG